MSDDQQSTGQQVTLVDGADDLDCRDDAEIDERCIAVTADGTQCSNARTHMTDDPFCASHSRADNVEVVGDE